MPFDQPYIPESSVTQNLKAARQLITPRNKWTVGVRRTDGGSMCALGALDQIFHGSTKGWTRHGDCYAKTDTSREVEVLAKFAHPRMEYESYRNYGPAMRVALHNNHLGHEATLQMFDEGIAESIKIDTAAYFATA